MCKYIIRMAFGFVGLIVPILSYCSLWWDGMVVLLVYERQYYCSDIFLIYIGSLHI